MGQVLTKVLRGAVEAGLISRSPCDGVRLPAEARRQITVDAVRGLFISTPYGSDTWLSLLWSVGLTLVFAWLSVSRYRRSVTR